MLMYKSITRWWASAYYVMSHSTSQKEGAEEGEATMGSEINSQKNEKPKQWLI